MNKVFLLVSGAVVVAGGIWNLTRIDTVPGIVVGGLVILIGAINILAGLRMKRVCE